MKKIIDISPQISENINVWPGDTPFKHTVLLDMNSGDHLTLSSIQTTVHLGAHTDAPNHYDAKGEAIGARNLNFYLGECQVISVDIRYGERVKPHHIDTEINAIRVLVRTNTFPDPNNWNNDFAALSPELIEFLSKKNVILVGIDTPSIDLFEAKELVAHHKVYEKDMAILEGITLEDVADGVYELIALPLNLSEADASPVRAILREI